MSYAVRDDGRGWRAVGGEDDCVEGETFSLDLPALVYGARDASVVTMRQARLALLQVGKLDAANAAIAALPAHQRVAAQIEWEFASEVRKDSPFIVMLSPVIGLDEAGLASLFNMAAGL